MRPVLLTLLVAFHASAADDPKPVSAAEAVKLVDKPVVVVEMTVKVAKDRVEKRGIVYLDSEEDSKDAKNLGVAISAGVAAKLKAKGIDDLAAHFKGKTIRVKGCVMCFETRTYLPVLDPDQIQVVGAKK